ncbi:RES family NAD+ phosphorylase [Bradyrhizobium sp. C-145]|uniref:RES family NAD+ phosphorylase n=1 Tax=Bradyrhizobium sp. C-145 TaxID=574727 RepID=UPI0031F90E9D
MKVTDTLAEQEILERLIEATKPPVPSGYEGLHFLLMTPFRYSATNPYGSRFRRPNASDGVFYAAEHPSTAIAEMAFYRLLFFAESPGTSWPQNPGEYTGFAVEVATERMLDLTASPFAGHAPLYDLVDYTLAQAVADRAREAAIHVIKYTSVRDPNKGSNFAILNPSVFARHEPVDRQSWKLYLDSNGVRAVCEAPRVSIAFDQDAFSADPRMKEFVWKR